MNYRDWLQQLFYKIINPVVHGMIMVGITPNFITTIGLVMNIVYIMSQQSVHPVHTRQPLGQGKRAPCIQ